jgi:hypothetical protein
MMANEREHERFEESLVMCRVGRSRLGVRLAAAPDLSPAGKEKLANKIWMMAESKDHRLGITPAQAQEIADFSSLNRGWQ